MKNVGNLHSFTLNPTSFKSCTYKKDYFTVLLSYTKEFKEKETKIILVNSHVNTKLLAHVSVSLVCPLELRNIFLVVD